jgi:N-acetylneuraminic acid mutarotase
MKKIIFLLFISFQLNAQWQKITDFPGTKRDDGTVFTIGNKAYCVTGFQEGWSCTRNGFVFDGSNESWSVISSLPTNNERQYASSFSYNGYGYVFGGTCGGSCLSDLWKHDPTNDSWQSLSALPDSGRMGCSSFVLGDKAYLIGGSTSSSQTKNEVWEYDISNNSWQKKNALPFAGTWRGNGFSISDTGYVCNGITAAGSYVHGVYRYEAQQDAWTLLPNIILPARKYAACAVIDRNACFYGGIDSLNTFSNDFWVFNPSQQNLENYSGLTLARKGGMAFSLGGYFYYACGIAGVNRLNETWKNDFKVGVEDIQIEMQIACFPNPAEKELNVVFANPQQHKFNLLISDAQGKVHYSKTEIKAQFNTIDISFLTPGFYVLTVTDAENGSRVQEKFTVK